jgi:hypothetical protein
MHCPASWALHNSRNKGEIIVTVCCNRPGLSFQLPHMPSKESDKATVRARLMDSYGSLEIPLLMAVNMGGRAMGSWCQGRKVLVSFAARYRRGSGIAERPKRTLLASPALHHVIDLLASRHQLVPGGRLKPLKCHQNGRLRVICYWTEPYPDSQSIHV